MKYDFETIIDRDPAIRGTGKYRIMKDSKGNKPPKGIVPLSVADMEFRTAPCVIDAIKAEADFGVLGYHRLTDSFRESCCQWMKTRHDWDVQPDWIVPFEQVVPALYNAVWTFTQPGDGILIQTPDYHHFTGATVNTGRKVLENRLVADEKGHYTVDFDDFREKAKQAKLFFLCSPQNPTGRVWTEEELRRMGEICNEYGVMVVADEIHHDLIQPGYKSCGHRAGGHLPGLVRLPLLRHERRRHEGVPHRRVHALPGQRHRLRRGRFRLPAHQRRLPPQDPGRRSGPLLSGRQEARHGPVISPETRPEWIRRL